jgi:hypothetical protein
LSHLRVIEHHDWMAQLLLRPRCGHSALLKLLATENEKIEDEETISINGLKA